MSIQVKNNDPPVIISGWLNKWTNYVRGYKKRWFVIKENYLEYHMNPSTIKSPQGKLNIFHSYIQSYRENGFIISDGPKTFFIKAKDNVERNKWLLKLQTIKGDKSDEVFQIASQTQQDLENLIKQVHHKISDLSIINNTLQLSGDSMLTQLCNIKSIIDNRDQYNKDVRAFFEAICLHRSYAKQLQEFSYSTISDLVDAQALMKKLFADELEKRQHLEGVNEYMAENMSKRDLKSMDILKGTDNVSRISELVGQDKMRGVNLKISRTMSMTNIGYNDKEEKLDGVGHSKSIDEFFEPEENDVISVPVFANENNESTNSSGSNDSESIASGKKHPSKYASIKLVKNEKSEGLPLHKNPMVTDRRIKIPDRVEFSTSSLLIKLLKNVIGKDLAHVAMPAIICEPLSYLQRMSECMQNSYLLDQAAMAKEDGLELVFVAAFLAASYSSATNRINKPFNPLLHETYELDRTSDLGWRLHAEQVKHHPPTSTICSESKLWKYNEEITLKSSLKPYWIHIIPDGYTILELIPKKHTISYTKVDTYIRNFLSPWIEVTGTTKIVNHSTGYFCELTFKPARYMTYSYSIEAIVYSSKRIPQYILSGSWNSEIYYAKVLSSDIISEGSQKTIPVHPKSKIWSEETVFDNERKKMYSMSTFAIQMNEFDRNAAPTDSRRRKDIRSLENANHEDADKFKLLYEQCQRERRKMDNGKEAAQGKGCYFTRKKDEISQKEIYMSNNLYWECKDTKSWLCPVDIFNIQNDE